MDAPPVGWTSIDEEDPIRLRENFRYLGGSFVSFSHTWVQPDSAVKQFGLDVYFWKFFGKSDPSFDFQCLEISLEI